MVMLWISSLHIPFSVTRLDLNLISVFKAKLYGAEFIFNSKIQFFNYSKSLLFQDSIQIQMYVQVQQAINMWCPNMAVSTFWKTIFLYSSLNRAVSNVEGLKLKITAHKTFKNKFDQIHVGIKFIYCQNTSVIGYKYSDRHTCNVWPPLRTCYFSSHCNASECIFNRKNSPKYFILARDSFIH